MSRLTEQFDEQYRQIRHWRTIINLIIWDLYTKTPSAGYNRLAETLNFAEKRLFALTTSDAFYELVCQIKESEEFDQLPVGMKFTITKLHRNLVKERRIPEELNNRYVEAKTTSMQTWERAKKSGNYVIYKTALQNMIDLTKQRCSYTDPGKDPYEVLIDQYEEGMTTASIDRVFEQLKLGLMPMIDHIIEKQPEKDPRLFERTYDIDSQKKVQKLILTYIGFNYESGTDAESEHPLTIGIDRCDVRLTNHYYEHDPIAAMLAAVHEGGHAVFMQNISPELSMTEADDCHYKGLHESQSRFFENILARRRSFWVPIYGEIQKLLPELSDIDLDDFMTGINHVERSAIRIHADEVTYALHVILRYELEQMIFKGEADAESLPKLWNEKVQYYLQITPQSDAEGVLQDMHWSEGMFGYFPSYLLGNIYDGMFLEAMEGELGSIDDLLEKGQINVIVEWLNARIHRYGALHLPNEVLREVCGCDLTAEPLLRYFEKKYL